MSHSLGWFIPEIPKDILPRLFLRSDLAFQLGVFQAPKDSSKLRAGAITHGEQVVTGQESPRPDLLWGRLVKEPLDELIGIEVAVTRQAVEPVKLQMFVELRQAHKPLQRGFPHRTHVAKPHVIGHQSRNLLYLVARKAQPPANLFRHSYSDVHVVIKT